MFVDGNGQVLRLGDTYKMPVLAATLKQVARLGVETFYDGAIGDKLIQDVRARGGILTKEDLRQYRLVFFVSTFQITTDSFFSSFSIFLFVNRPLSHAVPNGWILSRSS